MLQSIGWMVIGLVAWSIWGNGRHSQQTEETNSVAVASPSEAVAPGPAIVGGIDGLIESVEKDFRVPGWYMYSTCQVESECSIDVGDYLAADLANVGSACEQHKSREWCQRQWRALKVICAQVGSDGNQVCDIATVRTGYSFDSGPLQILPMNVVTDDGQWTANAADYDGDGSVNPFSFPDAMAMSAKISRKFHDNVSGGAEDVESWMKTADKYRGGYSAERRSKIQRHGITWCETHSCATGSLVAAR